MLRKTLIGTACAVGLLAAPVAANAATVSVDGAVVKVTGTESADSFQYTLYEGEIILSGSPMVAGAGCAGDDNQVEVKCPEPAGGLQISTLGGDDRLHGYVNDKPAGWVTVDLGEGNDWLETYGADTVLGGGGNDELIGLQEGKANTFEGGAGNDKLRGGSGTDTLRGGEGDDTLVGNAYGSPQADVIDGGGGRDIVDDWAHPDAYDKTPATVTLDGAADDGFPGEGDNVTNVESIRAANGVVFRGTDAAEEVIASEVGGKGSQHGMGGDDRLQGSDDDETIDGGAGNDDIQAGYGNDTITGGAGTDTIVADRSSRCNEMHCDLSPGSASDTVDAVDGEKDTISCGPGTDTVRADAIDDVASDCENVTRGGGVTDPGAGPTPAPGPGVSSAVLAIKGAKTLKALKAGKLKVVVGGQTPGAKVAVRAMKSGKVVASGTGRADTKGSASVKLKLTAAGRKALKKARTASLVIKGGGKTLKLRLK